MSISTAPNLQMRKLKLREVKGLAEGNLNQSLSTGILVLPSSPEIVNWRSLIDRLLCYYVSDIGQSFHPHFFV